MPNQQEPKKPRRAKSKRLNLNKKSQWEKLLKEVSKEQVPIGVLRYITINLKDGTAVDIDIEEMLNDGQDPELIEQLISDKLIANDAIIRDVDFHINVNSVAKTIQPYTDQLLKNL